MYNSLGDGGNGIAIAESRVGEAYERKRRPVDNDPPRTRQTIPQIIGHAQLPVNPFRHAVAPHRGQREEYLQPDEATRPLQGRQIKIVTFVHLLRHVGRVDTEEPIENSRLPAKEHAGTHRNRQPFVRIPGYGVSLIDAAEERAKLFRKSGGTAPGGVDMKPR